MNATQYRVPGLRPETSYSFTVFAVTSVGVGEGESVTASTLPLGEALLCVCVWIIFSGVC